MSVLDWANSFALRHFGLISFLLITMFVLATSILLALNRRLRRVARRYQELMTGLSGANLEELLHDISNRVDALAKRADILDSDVSALARQSEFFTQKLGLVRFNAFADTGSDLSFSLALLDAHNSGVVITSLYGREETRVYAKPVECGRSPYNLSLEERRAIEIAGSVTPADDQRRPEKG